MYDVTIDDLVRKIVAEEIEKQIKEIAKTLQHQERFVNQSQLRQLKKIGNDTIEKLEAYGLRKTLLNGRTYAYDLSTYDEAVEKKMNDTRQ